MLRLLRAAMGTTLGFALLIGLTGASVAATPLLVHDGDRVAGDLPAPYSEVGLLVDALEGTRLTVKVQTTGGSLHSDILLFDPDLVRIETGLHWPLQPSRKLKLRNFALPVTGRYLLVVRASGDTSGTFRLKLRASHPRRFRGEGRVGIDSDTRHLRFPAFVGSSARFKVRGKDGLRPLVHSMLRPDTARVPLEGVRVGDRKVRAKGIALESLGDHRLVVEARDGTTGPWQGRVDLTHTAPQRRSLTASGEPAGAFTSGTYDEPPGPPPPPPPPPPPAELRDIVGGMISSVATRTLVVARTAAEYVDVLDLITLSPWHSYLDLDFEVDFDREMVVAIFIGDRTSRHYAPWIDEAVAIGDDLLVKWREIQPGPFCSTTYEEVRPWTICAVPRVSGTVRFEGRAEARPCPLPNGP